MKKRAGADLVAVFSRRRAKITKLVDLELVPRFKAQHGRAPNQRELAALQRQAALRTRVNKDGVTDWDAAARGWQAKAAETAGVNLGDELSAALSLRPLVVDGCARNGIRSWMRG